MGSNVRKGKGLNFVRVQTVHPQEEGRRQRTGVQTQEGRCAGAARAPIGSRVQGELRGKGRRGEVLRFEDGEEGRK